MKQEAAYSAVIYVPCENLMAFWDKRFCLEKAGAMKKNIIELYSSLISPAISSITFQRYQNLGFIKEKTSKHYNFIYK